MISGGYGKSTVEYFSPDSSLTGCTLASLPGERAQHTMNWLTACGGQGNNTDNCVTIGPGKWNVEWKTSHTFSQGRGGHVSWRKDSDIDILLMGGLTSGTQMTTEAFESCEKKLSCRDSPP